MQPTLFTCCLAVSAVLGSFAMAAGAGPELLPAGPATRSVATGCEAPGSFDAAALAVHRYFYVEFPWRLQAIQNERQLAAAELQLIDRRLETYRPTRSFGRYSAAYTADHAWQVARLAALQRLEALDQAEAELWRERQVAASQGLSSPIR